MGGRSNHRGSSMSYASVVERRSENGTSGSGRRDDGEEYMQLIPFNNSNGNGNGDDDDESFLGKDDLPSTPLQSDERIPLPCLQVVVLVYHRFIFVRSACADGKLLYCVGLGERKNKSVALTRGEQGREHLLRPKCAIGRVRLFTMVWTIECFLW
mmetsp:Transcript_50231/g.92885  ORF Transcript_50231/g.92885 Transcript_50231/m.92885 type:complete len:155 (-) Transcript_50231:48-512(-)